MNTPYVSTRAALSRRTFLRSLGVAFSLPMLDAMTPVFAGAVKAKAVARQQGHARRFFGICNNLGLLPEHFFPKEAGRDYALSPYLELLKEHRDDFTVFSGVSHPEVDGGHPADNCFLTAAPHPGSAGFRNTISLDQFIAERIGHLTRFPSLTLGVNVQQGMRSLSWSGSGVLIPCEEKAADVFARMFIRGTKAETEAQVRRLQMGQSILDAVGGQARRLAGAVGSRDRDRLDQYFISVRELEQRLQMAREWERQPKPVAPSAVPLDPASPKAYMDKVKLMYDMAKLAFETDSTRSISLLLDSVNSPAIEFADVRTSDGYHNLSHHGRSKEKLAQLKAIDEFHMRLLSSLFRDLRGVQENGETLLDRTMILYGSNLGNANTHVTTNIPVILAGGAFRHGQHLKFDVQHNYPLPNLFVSMLQNIGIECDRFATSSGTMSGLVGV